MSSHELILQGASFPAALRPATPDDVESLQALLAQLGYTLSLAQIKTNIEAYTQNLHGILVAEKGGRVVGFIAWARYGLFVTQGRCMHIESLVVDQEYRGQGIGKQLLKTAEAKAWESGCTLIELVTYNTRKKHGTHAFYEKNGYQDHQKAGLTYFVKEKKK